jgi:hypothetical protein
MTYTDHMSLQGKLNERQLIELASSKAEVVYLDALDKGLSGASVWQAKWPIATSGRLSNVFVLKIGATHKLDREHQAFQDLVETLDTASPKTRIFHHPTEAISLLRTEFVSPLAVKSLRDHLRDAASAGDAGKCIDRLFSERMKVWHYSGISGTLRTQALGEALDWWVDRRDILGCANRLGFAGVNQFLVSEIGLTVEELSDSIEELALQTVDVQIGIVHGDLHTQNVLVDEDNQLHLIDFGWTADRWRAVDFLMLECSLKYLVAPRTARFTDLISLDSLIDDQEFGLVPDMDRLNAWGNTRMFGTTLAKVASAVLWTRVHALRSGAVSSENLYRQGLAMLGAGLSSMPPKINLALVLASTGHQVKKVTGA